MQQLTLFEDVPPPGYHRVPEIGESYEWDSCWADGDTSPEALQKLAEVELRNWKHSERTTTGDLLFFRKVATRVEGDHVVVTSVRIETPAMFRKRHEYKDEDEEYYGG